jgi:repressor LexA
MNPTKHQRKVLTFISSYTEKHGYSPSYREIAEKLKYSSIATVALHVDSLIERGYLVKRPNEARSLVVVDRVELDVVERTKKALEGSTKAQRDTLRKALELLGYHRAAELID